MPEENVNDPPMKDEPEPSASAVFVEMMRQAAAKAVSVKSTSEKVDDGSAIMDSSSVDPDSAEAAEQEISLEAHAQPHRVRRVRRRVLLRRPQASSMASGFFGTIFVVVISTALVATLLMFFVNPEFVNPAVVQGLQLDSEQIIAGVAAGRPDAGADTALAAAHRRCIRSSRPKRYRGS